MFVSWTLTQVCPCKNQRFQVRNGGSVCGQEEKGSNSQSRMTLQHFVQFEFPLAGVADLNEWERIGNVFARVHASVHKGLR